MRKRAMAALIAAALPAAAEEPVLSGAEITAMLGGKTVRGVDGGKPWVQLFQHGGVTLHGEGASQSQGFWQVRGDQYCSQWPPNETWSCYAMTGGGGGGVFIAASGRRWTFTVDP